MDDRQFENSDGMHPSLEPQWVKRSGKDRRTSHGRQAAEASRRGRNRRSEAAGAKERRKSEERRQGWMRVDNWCSVSVFDDCV